MPTYLMNGFYTLVARKHNIFFSNCQIEVDGVEIVGFDFNCSDCSELSDIADSFEKINDSAFMFLVALETAYSIKIPQVEVDAYGQEHHNDRDFQRSIYNVSCGFSLYEMFLSSLITQILSALELSLKLLCERRSITIDKNKTPKIQYLISRLLANESYSLRTNHPFVQKIVEIRNKCVHGDVTNELKTELVSIPVKTILELPLRILDSVTHNSPTQSHH